MKSVFEESLIMPGSAVEKHQIFVSLLTPINLVTVACSNLCFLYKRVSKHAGEEAVQKMGCLRLESSKVFTSQLVLDSFNKRILTILNKNEIVSWSLDEEKELTSNAENVSIFKAKSLQKLIALFSVGNDVTVLTEDGDLFNLARADVTFSIPAKGRGQLKMAEMCQLEVDDGNIKPYLIACFIMKSNKSCLTIHYLNAKNVKKSEFIHSVIYKSQIEDLSLPKIVYAGAINVELKFALSFENGDSKIYDLKTGWELKTCPFQVKAVLSSDKFVCHSKDKLFTWCEPLNHVMTSCEMKNLKAVCADQHLIAVIFSDNATTEL